MRPYDCPVCSSRVFFENTQCTACGSAIGYEPVADRFVALGQAAALCANHEASGCNWVVTSDRAAPFCLACDLNELIPPIDDPDQRRRFAEVETAKRRLVYSILRLSIPIHAKRHDPTGLSFRILVNAEHGGAGEVTMGHANGVITIDATEADAHLREFRRAELDERYRTLLGHMRHESGHYFWERLFLLPGFADAFRGLFGDERADYGEALQRHYANGAPADWRDGFISAYATAHPWEDWAETFAHYLHIVDGTETAQSFGVAPSGDVDPHAGNHFGATLSRWNEVALAMNAMNRSMGHQDFYPFVVNEAVAAKLDSIHRWLKDLHGQADGADG